MSLAEKLVALRKQKGLTQMELAEKLNVSRQAISRWEVGSAVPSTDNLKTLGDLYGVSVDYLLSDIADNVEDQKIESIDQAEVISRKGHMVKVLLGIAVVLVIVVMVSLIAIFSQNRERPSASANITAISKAGGIEQQYSLHVAAASMETMPQARGKDQWYHAGYIDYCYSEAFACDPVAVVSWKDVDSCVGTYVVDTYSNSYYSDWIATITSSLIAFGLSKYAPATIAANILSSMIGYFGSEVVNDIISIPFSEEYECASVFYTMRAEVIGSGMDTDVVDYEGGVEHWVKYVDAPDENFYEGWTPRTWACRTFAEEVWDDSVPLWPAFPGVEGYPTYM